MEVFYKSFLLKNFNRSSVIAYLDFLYEYGYFEYDLKKGINVRRYGDNPLFLSIYSCGEVDGEVYVEIMNGCNNINSVKEFVKDIQNWLDDKGTENIRPTPAI